MYIQHQHFYKTCLACHEAFLKHRSQAACPLPRPHFITSLSNLSSNFGGSNTTFESQNTQSNSDSFGNWLGSSELSSISDFEMDLDAAIGQEDSKEFE
jgi:hypothetical protein